MKKEHDSRIISKYEDLIKLKQKAKTTSFKINKIKTSKLAGRHESKLRGRGIDFEEIKNYRKGDDVKSIDWKLTLRTGTPYIRSYTEEKDRNILVCVDQRKSMFFSSVNTMKSVVAAEIAAFYIFKMISNNDRIGGFISNDHKQQWFSPRRGEKNALNFIKKIAEYNNELFNNNSIEIKSTIEKEVDELLKRKVKSSVIAFISDFYEISENTINKMKKLQHTNDVICIHIWDILEKEWDQDIEIIFSDGEMQFSSKGKNKKIKGFFNKKHKNKQQKLLELSKIKGIPFIELNTNGNHLIQLIEQIKGV